MKDLQTSHPRWPSRLLLILLLAGLLAHIFWMARPLERLVAETAVEDAFYYFQTARNVADGNGSTSAGGIPHNGYHPLWMLMCAAFFWVVESDLFAVRLILGTGAVLHVLNALLVRGLLRRMGTSEAAAVIGALVFAFNPWMRALAVSGLEAPLNALLLALVVRQMLVMTGSTAERKPPQAAFAVLGVLVGLTWLVRTDNAFFLLATGVMMLWRLRRDRRMIAHLFLSGAIALVVVLPWILWNLQHFGSIAQNSASALPIVREIAWRAENPGADYLQWRLGLFASWWPAILYYSGLGSLWYLMAFAVGVLLLTRRARGEGERLVLACLDLLPLLAGVICLGIAHKFFRLATREWYYVTSDLFLALTWGLLTEYLLHGAPRLLSMLPARRVRITVVALLCCATFAFLARKTVAQYQERLDRPRSYAMEIVDAINQLPDLGPGERVGVTDSGTVGFFSEVPAVNLDGVVNPAATHAIRRAALLDYIESLGIRYLLITPRMLEPEVLGSDWETRIEKFPAMTPQGWRLTHPDF